MILRGLQALCILGLFVTILLYIGNSGPVYLALAIIFFAAAGIMKVLRWIKGGRND